MATSGTRAKSNGLAISAVDRGAAIAPTLAETAHIVEGAGVSSFTVMDPFFQMEGMRGNTPALVFELADGGIDDVVAALAAKGVTIVTPVSEAPGGWSADFLDPDGFGLGLYQSGEVPRSKLK